jgi:hypothetical protein
VVLGKTPLELFARQQAEFYSMAKNNKLLRTQFITFIDLNGNPVTVDTGDFEMDAKVYKLIAPINSPDAKQEQIEQKILPKKQEVNHQGFR